MGPPQNSYAPYPELLSYEIEMAHSQQKDSVEWKGEQGAKFKITFSNGFEVKVGDESNEVPVLRVDKNGKL